MRFVLILTFFAAIALGSGELSGRRAPGFSLPEVSTKQHDLQDYRGKILLVEFMQTSCAHCVKFSGILEAAKVKYGNRIAVLSIVNPPSDQKSVSEYVTKNKVTSPILFDCGQVSYSYLRPTSNNIAIPHIFLIDAEGMIRNDFGYGLANTAIFEGNGLFTELDRVLAAKPAGSPKR